MLINLRGIAIAAIIAFVLGGGVGWKWRDYQAKAAELIVDEKQKADFQLAVDAHTKELADANARAAAAASEADTLRANQRKAQPQREKEYVKAPYAACPVPVDGLRILNEAASGYSKSAGSR